MVNGQLTRTILAGVAITVVASALIGLWSAGGFVTRAAYAQDQAKLDRIIDLIESSGVTTRRAALDAEITGAERRIEELQLYLEADPGGSLAVARRANIRRLETIRQEAIRRKAALDAEYRY